MKNLNNSIKIIIGINILLVPIGKMWIKKLLFFFVKEIIKIGIHKLIIIIIFNLKCLVKLKLKKFNDNIFKIKTKINILMKKKFLLIL